MANQKVTQLTAATALADDDQDLVVQNYSTTPVSRRRPLSLLKSTLKTYFDTLYLSISGTPLLPISVVDGLTLSNNGTDAVNDLDVAAGKAVDSGGTENMVLVGSITKRLDAAWSVGTNQGGLDTGTKATNTWYHIWLIKRTDTGVVDVLFSTSPTAPTMPTNYTKKRRIGAVRTDGTGILAFLQFDDTFLFKSPILSIDTTVLGTTRLFYVIAVPGGIKVEAILNVAALAGSVQQVYISAPDVTDLAPSNTAAPLSTIIAHSSYYFSAQVRVYTDTSSQISARSTAASTTFRGAVLGWVDPRGKW